MNGPLKKIDLSGEDTLVRILSTRWSTYGRMRTRVGFFGATWSRCTDTFPARYKASQVGAEINKVQKEIGQLKKVRHRTAPLLKP